MLREIKTILARARTPSFGTCALAWANESSRLYVEINLGILGDYSIRGIFIRLHFASFLSQKLQFATHRIENRTDTNKRT